MNKLDFQYFIDEIYKDSSSDNLSGEDIALQHIKEQDEIENADLDFEESEANFENPEIEIEDYKILTNLNNKTKTEHEKSFNKKRLIERDTIKEALTQTYLDLNTNIKVEDKKMLISFLVSDYAIAKNKAKAYIDFIFNKYLKKFIPQSVIKQYNKFPDIFIPHPGFLYKCTTDWGEGKSYWVELDLPMYIRPEACEDLFKSQYATKVPRVEKAIVKFHNNKQLKIEYEVKHARTLTSIATFYNLLKTNPYWYYLLVSYLKQKNKLDG